MSSNFSLFCLYADDVRQEANGKQIIVGLYQGGMNVAGPLPVTLPQLYVLGHLMMPSTSEPIEHLRFTAEYAGKMLIDVEPPMEDLKLRLARVDGNAPNDAFVMQMTVGLQPFVVEEPGRFIVKATINRVHEVHGNALTIRLAESTPATKHPAKQGL